MLCPKCNHENPDDAFYCGLCYEVLQKQPPKTASRTRAPHFLHNIKLHTFILAVIFAAIAYVYVDSLLARGYYIIQVKKEIASIWKNSDKLKFELVKSEQLKEEYYNFPPETVFSVYNISGNTFEQVLRNIREKRMLSPDFDKRIGGPTITGFRYEFEWVMVPDITETSAKWKEFRIIAKNYVIYPVWNEYSALRNVDLNRWKILMAVLLHHEAGHARINFERAKFLEDEVRSYNAPNFETLEKMTIEKKYSFLNTIQEYHDQYDNILRPGFQFVKLHKKF